MHKFLENICTPWVPSLIEIVRAVTEHSRLDINTYIHISYIHTDRRGSKMNVLRQRVLIQKAIKPEGPIREYWARGC